MIRKTKFSGECVYNIINSIYWVRRISLSSSSSTASFFLWAESLYTHICTGPHSVRQSGLWNGSTAVINCKFRCKNRSATLCVNLSLCFSLVGECVCVCGILFRVFFSYAIAESELLRFFWKKLTIISIWLVCPPHCTWMFPKYFSSVKH